jgi:signal transduction histidine kinase
MNRILVIEDNGALREEIANVLRLQGFDVATAGDGSAGLAEILRRRPDLVVCDVMMPGLDGFELLRAIRSETEIDTLPVLILTGRDDRESMRYGMELGADDYLMKPFKVADLLRAIDALFAKHARAARRAEQTLDHLRAHIADALPHELGTPLACIMGYAEMLADPRLAVAPPDVTALARQILGAGQRLNRMSENALLYVQLELLRHGRGDVRREDATPTLLDEIVARHARALADAHGRARDLALELAAAPVAVNVTYVEKIVGELVDNAFRFSTAGTPVSIAVTCEGASGVLRVCDAGPGMSAEQIAAVGGFVQFPSAPEQTGLGLGLCIAQRAAALWGGTLAIASDRASGTTITVTLPAADPTAAHAHS